MFVVRMFVYVYIRVLCSGKNAVVRSIECSHIVGNFFPFKNESGGTVGCAVVVSLAGSRDRIADARLDTTTGKPAQAPTSRAPVRVPRFRYLHTSGTCYSRYLWYLDIDK